MNEKKRNYVCVLLWLLLLKQFYDICLVDINFPKIKEFAHDKALIHTHTHKRIESRGNTHNNDFATTKIYCVN